jgi:hypothetical protein
MGFVFFRGDDRRMIVEMVWLRGNVPASELGGGNPRRRLKPKAGNYR